MMFFLIVFEISVFTLGYAQEFYLIDHYIVNDPSSFLCYKYSLVHVIIDI